MAALARLTPRQRIAVVLRFVDDRSEQEVAATPFGPPRTLGAAGEYQVTTSQTFRSTDGRYLVVTVLGGQRADALLTIGAPTPDAVRHLDAGFGPIVRVDLGALDPGTVQVGAATGPATAVTVAGHGIPEDPVLALLQQATA